MPRFLSIGECMVEVAPAGDGLHRVGYAGDTFNAAWYARRLLPADWDVAFASRVGRDVVSDRFASVCEEAGVVPMLARDPDRTMGLYLIELDGGERSFAYWRGQSAARRLADDEGWLAGALAGADVILFSGITLAILPPEGRARLLDALAAARASGTRVAFDTNQRPRLWESADALRAGLADAARVSDVVLPSLDEEQSLFGDADARACAARYRDAGAGLVVVKDGPRPILVTGEDFTATVAPAPVADVVDTTAAGDSFAAAFLAAHATGADAHAAAERAAAVSAQVICGRGALVEI